jgi:hypothetical protein
LLHFLVNQAAKLNYFEKGGRRGREGCQVVVVVIDVFVIIAVVVIGFSSGGAVVW